MSSGYNYQTVQDVEANKPPPYTSTYLYETQNPPPTAPPPNYGSDNEAFPDDSAGISTFSEKSIRHGFIRKVFGILFVQLLVSIAIVLVFIKVEAVKYYAQHNMALFWFAWIAALVVMIVIACCEKVRRSFPMNFICLGLFTLFESLLLGVVSAFYKTEEVVLAMGIVAVVTLALVIFAMQTKFDFTTMGGCLFVAVIVLFCFGILTIFFHNTILRLVYACLGALIFGLYLVFDVQMMMGGQKKYALDPEDYVFAALNLYIDIVTLFLYILQIIGLAKS